MDHRNFRDWRESRIQEMDLNENNLAILNIMNVGELLKTIYLGSTERAIKSLFLINSGGIVTILAYIYNAHFKCQLSLLSISLILFLIGLLSAFLVVIFDFFSLLNILRNFDNDVRAFLTNQTSFAKIRQFQIAGARNDRASNQLIGLGLTSAGAAILGIVFGLCGYLI